MDIHPQLVNGIIGLAGLTLLGNSGQLIRLGQKISAHTRANEEMEKNLQERLTRVEKKLPNGEVSLMYEMMKQLYNASMRGNVPPHMELRIRQVDKAVRDEEAKNVDSD